MGRGGMRDERAALPRLICDTSENLLVAETFDGVELSGADGGDHAADDADETENHCGYGEAAEVDVEMNVAGLEIFTEGAHERERADGPGNQIGDGDAAEASGEGDGESFGEEL